MIATIDRQSIRTDIDDIEYNIAVIETEDKLTSLQRLNDYVIHYVDRARGLLDKEVYDDIISILDTQDTIIEGLKD